MRLNPHLQILISRTRCTYHGTKRTFSPTSIVVSDVLANEHTNSPVRRKVIRMCQLTNAIRMIEQESDGVKLSRERYILVAGGLLERKSSILYSSLPLSAILQVAIPVLVKAIHEGCHTLGNCLLRMQSRGSGKMCNATSEPSYLHQGFLLPCDCSVLIVFLIPSFFVSIHPFTIRVFSLQESCKRHRSPF